MGFIFISVLLSYIIEYIDNVLILLLCKERKLTLYDKKE
nr:MAG TPA: hypothetical protein [Caudoviricetes sp.]